MYPPITLIVAMDKNRVIGKNGDVPWRGRLRSDMDHFRNTTMGNVVVMGRKTYDSLPLEFKPLPKRENIVLTNNYRFEPPGCARVNDPLAILRIAQNRKVFIIGGGEVYRSFLPAADRILATEVETEIQGGDTFFPEIGKEWIKKFLFHHKADEKNDFPFTIFEYTR